MKAEQQVGTQLNRQNSSNPSTEAYRLADKITELEILDGNNITLKESYINLMDQLEIDGIPKEKISKVVFVFSIFNCDIVLLILCSL